jgi:hypothetical protein
MIRRDREEKLTDKDTQVAGDKMERRDVGDMAHDTANTGQDGSKTNDGMQSGDCLWQIRRCDALANQESWESYVSAVVSIRAADEKERTYLLEFPDWPRHQIA